MIFLRSLIAVGFMLSVSGTGLELIVCDGPVSFKAANTDLNGHKHHHSPGHTEKSQLHISPSCSDWSTSSLLVSNNLFDLAIVEKFVSEVTRVNDKIISESFDSVNQIRAPPSLI